MCEWPVLQTQAFFEHDPIACAEHCEQLFQPIVSATSLIAHGFEALTCLPPGAPFADVHDLLDAAHQQGRLREAERMLLCGSIERFATYQWAGEARLFCNVDTRIFDDPLLVPSNVLEHARRLGLNPAHLCLEMSERSPPQSPESLARLTDVLIRNNVRIAIDDFGRGVSGLQCLMLLNPHYIKIDRLFIDGVARSARQQTIVGKVIGLSHALGLLTIAQGVENEADLRLLREIGCDFVQGYLIARPGSPVELKRDYSACCPIEMRTPSMPPRVAELLVPCEPISIDDPLAVALARFVKGTPFGMLPVLDRGGQVLGAVMEEDMQPYLFGEARAALLNNSGLDDRLEGFVRRCPISEATASPGAIVESFLVASGARGLVLTLDGRYAGLLSSQAILHLSWERALEEARDRNPLSALPGNKSIRDHLDFALRMPQPRTLVFFDFDNFKCFNDVYGFAQGDRVILDFAELLVKLRHAHNAFVGHIGGDDFFASVPGEEVQTGELVREALLRFRDRAETYYTPEHRTSGGIWATDRFGEQRFFPLLRASAVILELPASRSHVTQAKIIAALASGKATAKNSPEGLNIVHFPATAIAASLGEVSDSGDWADDLSECIAAAAR